MRGGTNRKARWRLLSLRASVVSLAIVSAPLGMGASNVAPQDGGLTFAEHVAPIISSACVPCHRPNGAAPFSLITYQDVRGRAAQVVRQTRLGLMPPWKPEPGHGDFLDERRLSETQIRILEQWVRDGAPAGDLTSMLAESPPASEWVLGEPDLILEPAPYLLEARETDVYRNFVLPISIDDTRYVKAWQFLAGGSHTLHHATIQFDTTGASRRLDAQDREPGYEGLIPHTVQNPEGYFLSWTPGQLSFVAPPGMSWPVRPGTDLVMMLHLQPSRSAETIRPRLGLYLADGPPSRVPTMIRLTRQDLDIPAGARDHRVEDSFTLDVDVDVYAVQPHAHHLAREVRAEAIHPDGTRAPLLYIRAWDFRWQDIFRYREPVFLPAGTTLRMEYIYDNSRLNRANPSSPPQRVRYGQRTTDEMAEVWLQVVVRDPSKRPTLIRAVEEKIRREEIVGREKMLEVNPASTSLHNDVALLHIAAGALHAAARHFAEVVQLEPQSPAAHYNYANVLIGLGDIARAPDHFAKALALKPDYALAHAGLGKVRRAEGRLDDARRHLREAARIDPRNAEISEELAALERELERRR
jgi:Flp pilus assembly protein TadD